MPLTQSGTLSILDIAGEFGGSSNPESLSEFYRGGSRVPNSSGNSNVPTSGTIRISNFYGASAVQPDIISGTSQAQTYGSGKSVSSVVGIRPTTTNWDYEYNGSAFVVMQTTAATIPTVGSWSDNYADGSNVTILAYYYQGTGIIGNTRITSNNMSALHGKTRSVTQTTTSNNVVTTTATQGSTFTKFGAGTSPSNQYIADCTDLSFCKNNTTLTVSWT